MLKWRLVTALASFLVLVTVAWSPSPANAAPNKVSLCHIDDVGAYHLISVSDSALSAHLSLGDGMPGDAVPGMNGYVFGQDCSLIQLTPQTSIQPGCYASNIGWTDLSYDGSIGTIGNVTFFESYGGTCQTAVSYDIDMAIIVAPDLSQATQSCADLGLVIVSSGQPLNGTYYGYTGLPTNTWLCLQA